MEDRFDRRAFVGGAAAGAGALLLLRDPLAAAGAAGRRTVPLARDGKFSHGVVSGQPGTRAISLWTRLDEVERTSRLRLEIATGADFRKLVHRQTVTASKLRDYTVNARVASKRLKPGEQYFYRFATRNGSSPVGRFRTALPPDSRQPVRIGFFSCQDWEAGYYTAHAGLAAEPDLDLVVCLGDYIYERHYYDGPAERKDTLGANKDGEVQTLDEYRAKYRMYRTDPNLQAMHLAHPMVAVWDDHEVEDNYSAELPGEATGQVRVPFAERRRNAYLAFFENMPQTRVRSERNRVYRRLGVGGLADLFLLDQRQYRDDQPCGDRTVVPPCPEADDPGRKYLGDAQKEWLKRGLAASKATWKLVGNPLMIMSLDVPNGNPLTVDSWDGYAAERQELLDHVKAKGVKDVAFITGDIHTFFAGNVTPSGREPGESVATEFVCGSITSHGIEASLGAPENSEQISQLTENVQLFNPHIKYNDQAKRGYGVVEASPGELVVEFKAPETAFAKESPVSSLKKFRVAAGRPEVELL